MDVETFREALARRVTAKVELEGKGWREAAEEAGVTHNCLWRFGQPAGPYGRDIGLSNLLRVMRWLGCNFADLEPATRAGIVAAESAVLCDQELSEEQQRMVCGALRGAYMAALRVKRGAA